MVITWIYKNLSSQLVSFRVDLWKIYGNRLHFRLQGPISEEKQAGGAPHTSKSHS